MDPDKDLTPTQEMGGEDGDCTQSQGNVTGENQAEQPNLNDPTPETSGTNQVADDNQRDQSNGATEQSAGTNSSLSAQEDNSLIPPVLEIRSSFVKAINQIDQLVMDADKNPQSQQRMSSTWVTSDRVRDVLSETNEKIRRLLPPPPDGLDNAGTPSRLDVSNASTEYMSMPLTEAAWQEMPYTSQGMEGQMPDLENVPFSQRSDRRQDRTRRTHDTSRNNDPLTDAYPLELENLRPGQREHRAKENYGGVETSRIENIPSSSVASLGSQIPDFVRDTSISKKDRRIKRPCGKSSKAYRVEPPEVSVHRGAHQIDVSPERARRRGFTQRSHSPVEDDFDKKSNTLAGRRTNTLVIDGLEIRQNPTPEELELYDIVRRVRILVAENGQIAGINFIMKNFAKSPHYDTLLDVVRTTFTRSASPHATTATRSNVPLHDTDRNIDPESRGFYNIPKPKFDLTRLPAFATVDPRLREQRRPTNSNSGNGQSSTLNPTSFSFSNGGAFGQGATSSGNSAMPEDDMSKFVRLKKASKSQEARGRWEEQPLQDARFARAGGPNILYSHDMNTDVVRDFQRLSTRAQTDQRFLASPGDPNFSRPLATADFRENPSDIERKLMHMKSELYSQDLRRTEQMEDLDRMIRSFANRLDIAVANTRRVLDGQQDLMQRLTALESENDINRRINDVLLHQFSMSQSAAHQARQEAENMGGINVRASAFRRPGQNIGEHAPSGLQPNGVSWPSHAYPTFSPIIAPPQPLAVPATAVYHNATNVHVDNQHPSNLSCGIALNNVNRDGFVFNQPPQLGYQSHNISGAGFGTGSGQPVLNNLTLNNQIQQPRPRANNYWDNFRSYSRQNLLSSPKMNGATSSSCNAEARQAAGSLFLPEELNNQSGTSHQNNIRPDLVVNRNPVGNGSKAHLRSPQFVENIASSKKKNKDQSHIFRLNSSGSTNNAILPDNIVEDRVATHGVLEHGPAVYRDSRVVETRPVSFKVTTSDTSDASKILAAQVNRFLDENGHRPAFVLDLLQQLSSLGTDTARQHVMNVMQAVVSEHNETTVRINMSSPPQSPVRTPQQQHPQLGVVNPFNFSRTDDDYEENVEREAEPPDHQHREEPTSSSGLTTTSIVTTASGLQMTRITRDCTGRTGSVSAPAHCHEPNGSIPASADYNFRLDDTLDSDDGEIHDLMDLTVGEADRGEFDNDARHREEGGHAPDEVPREGGDGREEDDEHAGGGDASGFVPIRF